MSKCPFWSTANQKISCYSECPMNPLVTLEEVCPFKECESAGKINYKDIIDEDYVYSQENMYEFNGTSEL